MSDDQPSIPRAVPLIPLQYAAGATEQRWVTLAKLGSMEAQLARLKLQGEGVRCNLSGENMATTYSIMNMDVVVEVLAEDLERAREILASRPMAGEADEEESGYVDEAWRCPKCHQKSVRLIPFSWPFFVFCILLLGLPAVFVTRRKACDSCGHEW